MSIILKALKSSGKENGEKAAAQPDPGQDGYNAPVQDNGFIRGKSDLIEKSPSVRFSLKLKPVFSFLKNKRVIVLAGVFAAVIAVVVGIRIFSGGSDLRMIPTEVEIVDAGDSSASPQNDNGTGDSSASPQNDNGTGDSRLPGGQASASPQNDNISNVIGTAAAAFAAGNYDESIALYKQALETAPNNAQLHNSLGLAYFEKDLYSSASDEFQKAVELDGECSECFNNFGLLKSVLGNTVEAKTYLEKSIEISSAYPNPYFNLAVLYESGGDVGNAVRFYRQFLELNTDKESDIAAKVGRRVAELTGE